MDEPPVLPHRLRALAVAHPRRRHDPLVAAHVVHQPDEALVENGKLLIEEGFGGFDDGAGHGKGRVPGVE